MALITASEARMQIPGLTGTQDDAVLEELISVAGALIAAHLGYPPIAAGAAPTAEAAAYVRYQDGPGGVELRLEVRPVNSITSIYDSPDRSYAAADLVASGDYTLEEPNNGLVLLDWDATHGAWGTGRRAIKASYNAGYSTVPDWLQHAARIVVRHLWNLRTTQGATSQSKGEANIQLVAATALPEEARRLLAPFRLPRAVEPA